MPAGLTSRPARRACTSATGTSCSGRAGSRQGSREPGNPRSAACHGRSGTGVQTRQQPTDQPVIAVPQAGQRPPGPVRPSSSRLHASPAPAGPKHGQPFARISGRCSATYILCMSAGSHITEFVSDVTICGIVEAILGWRGCFWAYLCCRESTSSRHCGLRMAQ